MTQLTAAQRRALTIIRDHEIGRPGEFAALMWPDSAGWRRPAKCGNHGVSRGGGMRTAAGGYLGKLDKAGLIRWHLKPFGDRLYFLTTKGEHALAASPLASS